MGFKWQNQREFERELAKAGERFFGASVQFVREVTAETTGQAVKNAPKLTGALRASASFFIDGKFEADHGPSPPGAEQEANRTPSRLTRAVRKLIRGVFGFNMIYAAVQHENLGFFHRDGGAKYAERALFKVARRAKLKRAAARVFKRFGF